MAFQPPFIRGWKQLSAYILILLTYLLTILFDYD